MTGVSSAGPLANVQANSNVDVEMFMMQVSAERANNLESQMKDQVNEVKERQSAVAKLTKLLNAISAATKGVGDDKWITLKDIGKPSDFKAGADDSLSGDEAAAQWKEILEEYGCKATTTGDGDATGFISVPNTGNVEASNAAFQNWIDTLKGDIDGLNSQGQLDMIRLQSTMNKRNESFEQMSNMVNKFGKTKDTIISNMR